MDLDAIAGSIGLSKEILTNGLDDQDAKILGQFLIWMKSDNAPPWWSVPELAKMVS
jgi:hypothetical protein